MKRFISLIAIIILSALGTAALTTQDNGASKTAQISAEGKQAQSSRKTSSSNDPRVLRVGPSSTYLRAGLSTDDVIKVLGKPDNVSERTNGDVQVLIYMFARGEGRMLVTEFENDRLVRSYTETPAYVAQKQSTSTN